MRRLEIQVGPTVEMVDNTFKYINPESVIAIIWKVSHKDIDLIKKSQNRYLTLNYNSISFPAGISNKNQISI